MDPQMELDAKLWRGDLHAVVSMVQSQALTGLSRTMPQTRAEIVVDSRLLLRTSTLLEGWAVMLARWSLEASATGLAQAGPASDFLAVCAKSIDPPPAALLRRARRDGVVRRAHLARAIGQCLRHHSLWPAMAPEGEHNCAEYTRGGWTALHFAAAFGSAQIVEDLLALGASMAPLTRSGLTPLHVACAHGEVAAVAALAAAGAEDLAAKSGKVLLTCELGAEYDFVDASGERPVDGMGVRGMLDEGFKYPLAGGALGDHTQSNNEGMKAVFHGY